MQVSITKSEGVAEVRLSGRFDFNAHRDFRAGYEPLFAEADVRSVNIDLAGVDYLDSSALGMLLMLRERANSAKLGLVLANPRGMVRQALDIAHFEKLFVIS